jgi:hypothetical protein
MRRRYPATAPVRPFPKRCFQLTHPFHPLIGREFEVVDFRHSWGDAWLYFYDDEGELRSIRAGWTDWEGENPFVALSAGRAHFRVDDLLGLVALVAGLADTDADDRGEGALR